MVNFPVCNHQQNLPILASEHRCQSKDRSIVHILRRKVHSTSISHQLLFHSINQPNHVQQSTVTPLTNHSQGNSRTRQRTAGCLHLDRIAGGHRHHRNSGGAALARLSPCSKKWRSVPCCINNVRQRSALPWFCTPMIVKIIILYGRLGWPSMGGKQLLFSRASTQDMVRSLPTAATYHEASRPFERLCGPITITCFTVRPGCW